jgi:hypothetical protein
MDRFAFWEAQSERGWMGHGPWGKAVSKVDQIVDGSQSQGNSWENVGKYLGGKMVRTRDSS